MTPYYDRDGITVYNADCLDVLPTLDTVDHVVTDPSYFRDVYLRASAPNTKPGSQTPGRLGVTLAKLAAGDIGEIDELVVPVSSEIARLTTRWAIVFSDVENAHRWREALTSAGMRYARTGAWVKPDAMPQMSGDRPGQGFEVCTIMHANGPMRWNGGGHAAVWTHGIARGDERVGHPCPKPISLMRELVALFTNPGDVILDPFAGSLTTAVAAYQLGRLCIAIEREERWCEAGVQRLAQMPLPLEVER